MTISFNNVYLGKSFSVLGRNEHRSSIKADKQIDNYYNGFKNAEISEASMMSESIKGLLKTEKNIDLCINSDLQNQTLASNFSMREIDIPLLVHYSACSSFVGNLIIASSFINSGLSNIIISVSSHNLVSEKQFRFPIEYGRIRKFTNTFTFTGSISSLVSNKGRVKVEKATIGKVVDIGYSDVNNMGGVMAISCAKSIYEHLVDTNRNLDYYDVILTGDLGKYGLLILKDYLKEEYKIVGGNFIDAGEELLLDSGSDIAGASGPVCLPLILYKKILVENYKKILLVSSGALHSKFSTLVKESAPSISHVVSLEVIK